MYFVLEGVQESMKQTETKRNRIFKNLWPSFQEIFKNIGKELGRADEEIQCTSLPLNSLSIYLTPSHAHFITPPGNTFSRWIINQYGSNRTFMKMYAFLFSRSSHMLRICFLEFTGEANRNKHSEFLVSWVQISFLHALSTSMAWSGVVHSIIFL